MLHYYFYKWIDIDGTRLKIIAKSCLLMSQQEMYKNPTKHLVALNRKFEIFDKEVKLTAVQKKTW